MQSSEALPGAGGSLSKLAHLFVKEKFQFFTTRASPRAVCNMATGCPRGNDPRGRTDDDGVTKFYLQHLL